MLAASQDQDFKRQNGDGYVAKALGLIALFTALNYVGSDIYHRAAGVTTVKPYCGVALAICIIAGEEWLPTVLGCGFLGAVAAKVMFQASPFDTIFVPALATITVFMVQRLLKLSLGMRYDFRTWRELTTFILVSATVCACGGLLFAEDYFISFKQVFFANWSAWAVATTLSFVIFTPVIVLIGTASHKAMPKHWVAACGAFVAYVAVLGFTLSPASVPTTFMVPCALLIVTMTSELEGTAIALAVTQIIYTIGVLTGYAPVAVSGMKLGYQLQFTQTFIGILVAVMLPVAGAVSERKKLRDEMTLALAREVATNRELKDSQQKLREAAIEAAKASRAKSEFLAGMSHELRTPLNAIIGFSDIFQQQIFGPLGNKRYEEYARHIHSSGTHLLDLINDVLDLSKIDAGKMELRETVFSVRRLIEDAVAMVASRAGHIALEVDCTTDMRVRADERITKQILLNLLTNAIKFTANGSVVIGALINELDQVEIFVVDTGIGMTSRDLKQAMQQYGQIDSKLARKHQGTGLGLPLAKSLAELQGGSLRINSKPGEGTTATLVLQPERLDRAGLAA